MRARVVELKRRQIELVEDVEEIGAQFQVRFFLEPRQVRVLGEAQIRLQKCGPAEGIAADSRRPAGR